MVFYSQRSRALLLIASVCAVFIVFGQALIAQTPDSSANSKSLISIKADANFSLKNDGKRFGPYVTFVGLGPSYSIMTGRMSDLNKNALGLNLFIENRRFCNLWYGAKIDYFSLTKKDSVPDTTYFKSIFTISPEFKYVFNNSDCDKKKLVYYLQGVLNISAIKGADNKGLLGLGGSAGAGASYPFILWDRCWSVELSALYCAPNAFVRASGRQNVQFIDLSLSLSVGL